MKIPNDIIQCMTAYISNGEHVKGYRNFPAEKHIGLTKCILCGDEVAEVWKVGNRYISTCHCGMTQELAGKPLKHIIKMIENNAPPATVIDGKLQCCA